MHSGTIKGLIRYGQILKSSPAYESMLCLCVSAAIGPVCDPPSLTMELRETRPRGYCLDDEVKCVDPTGGEVTFEAEAGSGKEYMETRFNTGTDFLGLNACIRKSIKDQFGEYQVSK